MWFKNALIYRITKPLDWSIDTLVPQLEQHRYQPCAQSDILKFGWSTPLKGSESLYFAVGKQILLLAQKEEKMLPAYVIKRELDARVEKIEQAENRKLKKVEKQTLKDDVIATLLPRAFSKYQQTALWIDAENQLIYVDEASAKRAEETLALLRKSLGSLPVVPLTFANEPGLVMQEWIAQTQVPEWLVPLEEAELRDVNNGVIRCKQHALDSEDILTLVHSRYVTKLALEWEDRLSFVLNEDCSLKRLKFADAVREKNDDILKQDYAQRFDADFVLMTGLLSQLTENLLHDFGGEKVRL